MSFLPNSSVMAKSVRLWTLLAMHLECQSLRLLIMLGAEMVGSSHYGGLDTSMMVTDSMLVTLSTGTVLYPSVSFIDTVIHPPVFFISTVVN